MLEVGRKIKERREELKITQKELADKLGYKNRTTIAKIESGINDITQSKVVEFARALDTTPAYLMGWEDNLTEDNAELTVRMLQDELIIEVVRVLLKHDKAFTEKTLQYIAFLETQEH